MRRHPFYLLFGLLLIAGLAAAQYRGWALTRRAEVRNVPRTVRDNPGAYRSHYSGSGRYLRGK
ncbi:MAG TPA: hypothetical protein VFS05_13925 [Gemmatimonadaceae bacterium]|nr:hypothetical protein [Gemmatimonadaceae bacterium]